VAQNIPDVDAKYTKIENGPPLNYPVEIRIIGNEADALFEIADNVKGQLKQMNGVRNIKDDWGQRIKKLVVRIDQPRAWRAGVTSRDVAISLQAVLSGFDMTEFREEDKIIPVTLRSVAADRQDISKIESLNVYAQATGQSVPLRQVADIEVVWQPAKIIRRDRLKTVTVSADLYPGTTANEITSALVPRLDEQVWDIGYRYELGGEAETSGEANQSIKEQLPVAGIIIVLLLVGQFNSFRRAAIILFTIPLGLIGVILGLFAARLYFGFMTLLGIISLSGIVINNAIVLLERIKLEIVDNHLPPQKAVVEAAQRRLRPILLTTATTVFGMMPLYLKGGAMWEPMAMAIIAGLIFATLLTLGVVPVLFSLLFGVRFE
jgi:multidrug efflux pump subunit AcrB